MNAWFQAGCALRTKKTDKVLRKPTVKQNEFSLGVQEKGNRTGQELLKVVKEGGECSGCGCGIGRYKECRGRPWFVWGPRALGGCVSCERTDA